MLALAARDLCKSFRRKLVLDRVSFEAAGGERLAVIGPGGSGKTTLLRCIAGLEAIDAGSIQIDGIEADSLPPHQRRIAMLSQDYPLYSRLTVRQNLSTPLKSQGLSESDAKSLISQVVDSMQLESLLDRLPSELSGGQRQRVALAKAMIRRPRLLLLDEPLSQIDLELADQLRDELLRLKSKDICVIMVTHDPLDCFQFAERVLVLDAGRIVQIGTPHEIAAAPVNSFAKRFTRDSISA